MGVVLGTLLAIAVVTILVLLRKLNTADPNCNDFDVIENNKQLNSKYQNLADIENPQIIFKEKKVPTPRYPNFIDILNPQQSVQKDPENHEKEGCITHL